MKLTDFTTLTFDMMGTLMDYEAGFIAWFRKHAAAGRPDVADNQILEALARAEEVLQRDKPHPPFTRMLPLMYLAAASEFSLPVMIHTGQSMSPLPKLFELLKRGDMVTHMFAPPPNSIFDDDGRILPEVLAARRRGVWFDYGNGRAGHVTWDVAQRAILQGFLPDTFSTDWTPEGKISQVIDFPNVMSKFLLLGLTLDEVVARATSNSARVFDAFKDRGTRSVGAPADVAVLELRDGNFEFVDNFQSRRNGAQRLFPFAAIIGGKRVPARA